MPELDAARVAAAVASGCDRLALTVARDETDLLGIVFYRHLLAWFERGRENVISTRFLRQLFDESGESFVVTRSEQLFKAPAEYGERLEVRTVPFLDGAYRLHFDQSVWRGETCLVAGFVEMVTVSRSFSVVPVPASVRDMITHFEPCKRNFTYCARPGAPKPRLPPPRRAKLSEQQQQQQQRTFSFDLVIHMADTDFTGIAFHPNYYCWFERARTQAISPQVLAEAQRAGAVPVIRSAKLQYKKGARPYEPMRVLTKLSAHGSSEFLLRMDQTLVREAQELVKADIEIVFVDALSKKLVKVPRCVREALD
jgi:acyl-CoA thioester hydrolase